MIEKILYGWGYAVGSEPPNVVLSYDGGEYHIIYWPDDNPPTIAQIEAIEAIEIPSAPDWRAFQSTITVSPAFMRIAGHSGQTLTILPTLVYVCSLIESDATRAVQFAGLWNAIAGIAEPTTEEIAALNALAATNNVPFQLNSAGLIA